MLFSSLWSKLTATFIFGLLAGIAGFAAPVFAKKPAAGAPTVKPVSVGSSATPSADYRAVLNQYCVGCHNQITKTADLMLDKADLTHIPEQADVWEKVSKKLRSGMMPPVGM